MKARACCVATERPIPGGAAKMADKELGAMTTSQAWFIVSNIFDQKVVNLGQDQYI